MKLYTLTGEQNQQSSIDKQLFSQQSGIESKHLTESLLLFTASFSYALLVHVCLIKDILPKRNARNQETNCICNVHVCCMISIHVY